MNIESQIYNLPKILDTKNKYLKILFKKDKSMKRIN